MTTRSERRASRPSAQALGTSSSTTWSDGMLRPNVAHRPSVTLERRGSPCSSTGAAPIRRSANDGASRHTPYMTAAPATTNATMPKISETAAQKRAPNSSAGTTAVQAHSTIARRRLAATSPGRISGAPRLGSTWSGLDVDGREWTARVAERLAGDRGASLPLSVARSRPGAVAPGPKTAGRRRPGPSCVRWHRRSLAAATAAAAGPLRPPEFRAAASRAPAACGAVAVPVAVPVAVATAVAHRHHPGEAATIAGGFGRVALIGHDAPGVPLSIGHEPPGCRASGSAIAEMPALFKTKKWAGADPPSAVGSDRPGVHVDVALGERLHRPAAGVLDRRLARLGRRLPAPLDGVGQRGAERPGQGGDVAGGHQRGVPARRRAVALDVGCHDRRSRPPSPRAAPCRRTRRAATGRTGRRPPPGGRPPPRRSAGPATAPGPTRGAGAAAPRSPGRRPPPTGRRRARPSRTHRGARAGPCAVRGARGTGRSGRPCSSCTGSADSKRCMSTPLNSTSNVPPLERTPVSRAASETATLICSRLPTSSARGLSGVTHRLTPARW